MEKQMLLSEQARLSDRGAAEMAPHVYQCEQR